MKRLEYRVLTYDGYRGDERPRIIETGDDSFNVAVIEDSWVSTGVNPESETLRGVVVCCENGARFRAVYGEESGWQVNRLPDAPRRDSHLKIVD